MEDKTIVSTPPPPPSEVKIRTMRSDIESMMQSGGGAAAFKAVSVTGLAMDKFTPAPPSAAPLLIPGAGQKTLADYHLPGEPAPTPSINPGEREVVGEEVADAGPNSDLIPKLVVGLVALVALGVVGYFAYVIFGK